MGKNQAAKTAESTAAADAAPQDRKKKGAGQRAVVTLGLEVTGRSGTYVAETVDVSRTGALLWITDPSFAPSPVTGNIVFYRERVEEEFASGMTLRFTDTPVVREASVVRVTRKGPEDGDPVLVACRYEQPLQEEDYAALGIAGERSTGEPKRPKPRPRPVKRPRSAIERRTATRVDRILYVQVEGDYGSYKAHALNVSYQGVLLTITDPALAAPKEPHQVLPYTKRLGFQFGNGMRVQFLEAGVTVPADVVRVSEQKGESEPMIVIGCRFRRNLAADECALLEIDPPLPPAAFTHPGRSRRRDMIPSFGRTSVRELMRQAAECGATDLHVKVGGPPRLRLAGSLLNVGREVVTQEEAHAMALELMTPEQAERFVVEGDMEFAYAIEGVGRYRVNVLRQRDRTGLAIRCIPSTVPSLESLGLPNQVRLLAERPRGLVLVTGPTGAGKTTTLAAMVNHINRTRACHIITMEDPIEYVHEDLEAHITQREIGRDTRSFADALRRALRQDPDVLLVGEMRDLETMALALTAAETGHLVFATVHTTSAAHTPDRIVDVFPANQQMQIRLQLAETLQGILSQMLVPRIGGGVALVQEILIATEGVRGLIRESKAPQIQNLMQTGAKDGMRTLESHLNELVRRGVIQFETAVAKANFPKQVLPR